MNKKIILVLMMCSLFSAGSLEARDQKAKGDMPAAMMEGGPGLGPDHMQMQMDRLTATLDLSKEQKSKIKEYKYARERESIKIRSELQLKMLDMRHELGKRTIDDKKVDILIDEISASSKVMLKNKIESLKKLKTILTEEQWDQLQTLTHKNMRGKMGQNSKDKKSKRSRKK